MSRRRRVIVFTPRIDFSPKDIEGLLAWYRAESLTLSDGAAVGSWTDSSGNGHTLSQSTASLKPLFYSKTGIINGKPVVRFDGTDDLMTPATTYIDQTKKLTAYALVKPSSVHDGVIFTSAASSGDFLRYRNNAGTLQVRTGVLSGGSVFDANAAVAAGNWARLAVVMDATDSAAGAFTIYENNSSLGASTASVRTAPDGGLTFGSVPDGTQQWFNGDVAEIMIYEGAHTSTQRMEVDAYFTRKYAL